MGRGTVMPRICEEPYRRPDSSVVFCSFREGHLDADEASTPHSWTWLKDADKEVARDDTPSDVRAILDAITRGAADPYLEAILAVTHNRKRALRGTRGFPAL